jgi:hypothetical protein
MFKQIAKLIALLTWLTLMAGTAFAVRSSEQKKPNAYQQKLGEMESKGKLTEKQRQMLPDGKVETLSTMYDELFNLMKLNDAVFFQPDDRVLLKREVRYIYPKTYKELLTTKIEHDEDSLLKDPISTILYLQIPINTKNRMDNIRKNCETQNIDCKFDYTDMERNIYPTNLLLAYTALQKVRSIDKRLLLHNFAVVPNDFIKGICIEAEKLLSTIESKGYLEKKLHRDNYEKIRELLKYSIDFIKAKNK